MGWFRTGRRWAGSAKRALFPSAEEAAWRRASRLAGRTPRFERGRIELAGYRLVYPDLLTLCPQWKDLFVRETLRFALDDPAPRILDCGANVGLASLYFKRAYPRARVTAFEADPEIAEMLEENLQANGCEDVEVVRAAVWSESGRVSFRCEGADSGTLDELAGTMRGAVREVRSVRLRDHLERERVDVLKLDVEGAEVAVLEDCAGALEHVKVLLMELHRFEANGARPLSVLDLLDRSGFVWSLDDLVPVPWRAPAAPAESPFPGAPLCWTVFVRAFRPAGSDPR